MLSSPFLVSLGLSALTFLATPANAGTSLFEYANKPAFDSSDFNHWGPGVMFFSGNSVEIERWIVSSTDVGQVPNDIFIPMTMGQPNRYFELDSITISGYLDLEAGSKVGGIAVDISSNLANGGVSGSGQEDMLASSPYLVPKEGMDSNGYVGPFSVTQDLELTPEQAELVKTALCSGGVTNWQHALTLQVDMVPSSSDSAKGTFASTKEYPILIDVEASWFPC